MFERLRRDLKRYYTAESQDGSPGAFEKLKILLFSHGLQAVVVYRFGSWVNRNVSVRAARLPLKALYVSLNEAMNAVYGIYIHADADIAGGLFIPHPNGVMIGRSVVGEDCMIGQNATIGVRPGANVESPRVGDRVFIAPGAFVFGNIKIADGAAISPLTVVGRNVPPRALVAGNPMQIIKRNFDNASLLYPGRVIPPSAAATSPAPAAPPAATAATDVTVPRPATSIE
jgi:serine O-acetyltransferase